MRIEILASEQDNNEEEVIEYKGDLHLPMSKIVEARNPETKL